VVDLQCVWHAEADFVRLEGFLFARKKGGKGLLWVRVTRKHARDTIIGRGVWQDGQFVLANVLRAALLCIFGF
jgi:hypothetical protein